MSWIISPLVMLAGVLLSGPELPYFCSEPLRTSPSDELRCMYIDRHGMMWIGTNTGLKSYDGYALQPVQMPEELPGFTIHSITKDQEERLWLGTNNGLVRLDRKAGSVRSYFLPEPDQQIIYTLFTSSDGTVWIGTDLGLTRYDAAGDSFYTYGPDNTRIIDAEGVIRRLESYSVKSIVEMPDGDLFIGTWDSGLLRLDPRADTFLAYPSFNPAGSAFSLMLDSRDRLWIGSWGHGLFLMDRASDNVAREARIRCIVPARDGPRNFTRIVEDLHGGKVWAGDIDGICLFDPDRPDAGFETYRQTGGPWRGPLRYCSDLIADQWGNVWLGMLHDGIYHIRTQPSLFHAEQLPAQDPGGLRSSASVLFTDDGERLWMGLLPYGIALQDRSTGKICTNRHIPGFAGIPEEVFRASVSAIIRRMDGTLWIGTQGSGILAVPPDRPATLLNTGNTGFLTEDYITALFCDRNGYTWVGGRTGLRLVGPDGSAEQVSICMDGEDFSRCHVQSIIQDRAGHYWICTESQGIFRLEDNPRGPERFLCFRYSRQNGNYASGEATACLEDHSGTLWSISNAGGLSCFNRDEDRFERVSERYHIDRGRILAIEEDIQNRLWLAVDDALICLHPSAHGETRVRWYSQHDGLGDIMFSPRAAFRFGNELFFGSRNGYFVFNGEQELSDGKPMHLAITDLTLDGTAYEALPPDFRRGVSRQHPMFTQNIVIPASVREFRLGFSLLSHIWHPQNRYSYRLEGYDRVWHYPDRGIHTATYQNIPAGNYSFRLRAAAPDGRWQDMGYALQIRVLPPWYATWWAKTLSILSVIALIVFFIYWYIRQLKARQYLRMNQILTNITHELLTPLAVIMGSLEEMGRQSPLPEPGHTAIENNISRITRLLRQILEVRKSEAGKLRLLVCQGDLAAFVRRKCRDIAPMASSNGVDLQIEVPEQGMAAWFDPDKLDKILYNLVSNAVKYNREGGFVRVSLTADGDRAVLSIRDNGIGIPKEKMKLLFNRFLDGEYRKTRHTGTGLGLSLTRELVRIHRGTIRCESQENAGTVFTVRLPVTKAAYPEREIDTKTQDFLSTGIAPDRSGGLPAVRDQDEEYTMLVVEDNAELLELLTSRLSQRFRVLTAHNGEQALSIIRKEELDIVISDVMMPLMNGNELTRRIKESEDFAQLPVILLTALDQEEERISGYRAGADDYITKPFRLRELDIRIDGILRNRERIRRQFCRQADWPAAGQHHSSPKDRFIQRAAACVLKHLTDGDYDREAFAGDMCMSSASLYNKLRANTGLSITGFINSIRLKEACRIAREIPDIPIGELSDRVGYNSARYFAMCFRREFGLSPSEYLYRQRTGEPPAPPG